MKRCEWVGDNQLMQRYHDIEWGVPVHNDRLFFEFLTLEGAQAGLSWSTILNKREGYRELFDNFDVKKISEYSEQKYKELLSNPKIIRNRLKIRSTINNAKAFIEIQNEFGSFDSYIWKFTNNHPINNCWKNLSEIPITTEESDAMSKDLKKRGLKFIGSTICYAFMQAVGMVNDHTTDCFLHKLSH